MRRGEIRALGLAPVVGAATVRTRPAVIVSNDGANSTAIRLGRGVVTIVPITSNIGSVHPFQVLLTAADTGFDCDSKAQAEQVRSVAVRRLGKLIGIVPFDLMARIDDALRLHLDL